MGSFNRHAPQQFTITSSDEDELSHYFSERVSAVAVSPASRSDTVTVSATVVPLGQAVAFEVDIQSGATFRQREDLDGVFVFLPVDGEQARWIGRGGEIVCGPTTGFIGPMREADTMEVSGHWRHKALKVPTGLIARNLSQLLEQPIGSPVEFSPSIELSAAPVKAIASMVQLAMTPVDGDTFFSASPLAAAQFSETMVLSMLETFQHSYSSALSDRSHSLKPKHVKRAIAFMREHAGDALTLQDIAAASDVSVRALHYGFQKFVGKSPFEELRQIRLEAAYSDLADAPETLSIAEIARKWGFPNPGRFAQICKSSYGRSPSEIRKTKARARSGD